MSTMARWKIAASLLAIFVAGGVAGGLITARIVAGHIHRNVPAKRAVELTMGRWTGRLGLSAQQRDRIRPVVEEMIRELRELRARDVHESDAVIRKAQEKIEPELDPKQLETLRRMREQRRQRLQKWQNETEQGRQ